MLGNSILIIFLILLIKITFKSIKSGIISYIVFSLISPNLNIGNIQISYEILGFFELFIILLILKPKIFSIYRKYLYRQHLIMYLYIYIVASLFAAIKYQSSLPFIEIFSIFRFICIIYMLQYIMKDNYFDVLDSIIAPVLLVNLITSIIQITTPASVKIFYDFYYKSTLTPLIEVLNRGYFYRAYGTFGSPVLLGVFSIFSFAVYLGFLTEKRKCKRLYFNLIASVILGLLALSKIAILGTVSILILYYLLIMLGIIKMKNKKVLTIPLIVIPVFSIMVKLLEQHGTAILWYIGFLYKPLASLSTRYDISSGLLSSTYFTISSNWLIGVGGTHFTNEFLGDSMYIVILYTTGVIGLIIYFSVIVNATVSNFKFRNTTALLCFIAICLAGIAAPIHVDIISAPLIAFIFSNGEHLNKAALA